MSNEQLMYYGCRASGIRAEAIKVLFGIDPNEHEDDYLQLTKAQRETYSFPMGRVEVQDAAQLWKDTEKRASMGIQRAMADKVVTPDEYTKFKGMLKSKPTYASLINWLVICMEKRPELRGYLDVWMT